MHQRSRWPFRIATACLLAAALVPSRAGLSANLPAVTGARVDLRDAATRVVLEISDPVTYAAFTLADPHRVVIDLPQVSWRLASRRLDFAIGAVAAVRYGLFKPGTSRVVLDLSGPAAIDRMALVAGGPKQPHRLVIDLVATSQGAFLKTVRGGAKPLPSIEPAGLRLAAPRAKPLQAPRKRVVVLDPGHGGADPGAISVSGVQEKAITLAAARLIGERLVERGRYRVFLTRERDVFVRLRDRIAFAREAGAELFLSIHADAMASPNVRGASVYTLSETASDAEAAALAERENKADLISGVDLTGEPQVVANILIDLAQRETMNESARFAQLVVQEMGRSAVLLRNSHRFAGFAVLKSPDVPSVLVELGYLSNREDERLLRRRDYLTKVAEALTAAIDRYFLQVEEVSRR